MMVFIHPEDPSFRAPAWLLFTLALVVVGTFPRPFDALDKMRLATTVVIPTATFLALSHRHITLQRACAIRITSTKKQFERSMRLRALLPTRFVVAYGVFTAILLASTGLSGKTLSGWANAAFIASMIGLAPSAIIWVIIFDHHRLKFIAPFGVREVEDAKVPMEARNLTAREGGWNELYMTNRKQLVSVKELHPNPGTEEEKRRSFVLKTTLMRMFGILMACRPFCNGPFVNFFNVYEDTAECTHPIA